MKISLATILILVAFSVNSQELKGIRIGDYCADCQGEEISPSKFTTVAGVRGYLWYSAISSGGIYRISFTSASTPNERIEEMSEEEKDLAILEEINILTKGYVVPIREEIDQKERERNQAVRRMGINLSSAYRMKEDIEDYYGIKLINKESNYRNWELIVGNTIYRFYLNQLEVKQVRISDRPTYYLYEAHFVITDKLLQGIHLDEMNKKHVKLDKEKRRKEAQEDAKRKSDF